MGENETSAPVKTRVSAEHTTSTAIPETQILVVEDETDFAEYVEVLATRLGYAVSDIVVSGEEAVEAIAERRPDLILMDIRLQGEIDGIQTAEQICERFGVPVVYMTAYADKVTLEQIKATSPFGFLAKPFGANDLHVAIELALAKYLEAQAFHKTLSQLEEAVEASTAELRAANDRLRIEIGERERAEKAERQQRMVAEALRDTASVLGSTLDLNEVLDRILVNVGQVVPHDAAIVMLVQDGVARAVRHQGCTAFGTKEELETLCLEIAGIDGLLKMAHTGQPLVISDTRRNLLMDGFPGKDLIRSHVGAPICHRGKVIGFLNLVSTVPGAFTAEQAEHLSAFANQAAIAIENARLYDLARSNAAELQKHAEQLEIANAHLERLSRVKDEFVSNASHELRTPISSLKLYHDLIAHNPQKTKTYLATMRRETQRLEHIVEKLLGLSRLDQGRVDPRFGPVDLNRMIEECVADRIPLAGESGLELTFEEEPGLPAVRADESLLVQVLSALLTNALNYTPQGGKVTVGTLSERTNGHQWCGFHVSDTGLGIPADERDNLFERFFRGKVGRESDKPGAGLGLAIAKEIVDRHEGRIELESKGISGQGSKFTVWLPVCEK